MLISKLKYYLEIALKFITLSITKKSSVLDSAGAAHCMRGFDFYSPRKFLSVLVDSGTKYKNIHGGYPRLTHPTYFNEKLFYKKFFGNVKIPESGNKLLTSSFIPESVAADISCPKIIWHSPIAVLPDNSDIPAGHYYLKANHGSDMFAKVKYPMTAEEKRNLELKCLSWLNNDFGFWSGEWWYCVFQKEILLEVSISEDRNSIAIGFYIFHGVIKFIALNKKKDDQAEITWLDEQLKPTTYQSLSYPRVSDFEFLGDLKRLKRNVIEIAGKNDFVRVDVLLGDDGLYYLGEVTFSPGNALSVRPQELEEYLGSAWDLNPMAKND